MPPDVLAFWGEGIRIKHTLCGVSCKLISEYRYWYSRSNINITCELVCSMLAILNGMKFGEIKFVSMLRVLFYLVTFYFVTNH